MRVVANEIPVDESISKESGAPLAVPRSAGASRTSPPPDTPNVNVNDTNGGGGGQCDCASNNISEGTESSLCLSEDCILAAATVLSSLDRSADPCEDFYQASSTRLSVAFRLQKNMQYVQRCTICCAPGLVKFVPAVAYLLCLAPPGTQLDTLKNPHKNRHENRHEPKFEKETCTNFLFHEIFSISF